MRPRAAAAALAVLLVAGTMAPAAGAASELFRFQDARIDEASGIAVGPGGTVFVHNDSGDTARFFAVDASSGATRVTYTVAGARNVDWEDVALAPDSQGRPSVWLADIGDNDSVRTSVQLYRVAEPSVPATPTADEQAVHPTAVWNLRYPDGAHDAETLLVDAGGRAYVVTKSVLGISGVYEVPATPAASVQTMQRVATVRFGVTTTPGPFGLVGHLLATGGAVGSGFVVIRTYTDAYVWRAPDGVVAALRAKPVRVPLPEQQQGEGVAVRDSTHLLIDSEGQHSPVYLVPLTVPGSAPGASASTSASTSAGTSLGTGTPSPAAPRTTTAPDKRQHSASGTVVLLALAAAGVAFFAVGFAVIGLLLWLRRRRRV